MLHHTTLEIHGHNSHVRDEPDHDQKTDLKPNKKDYQIGVKTNTRYVKPSLSFVKQSNKVERARV